MIRLRHLKKGIIAKCGKTKVLILAIIYIFNAIDLLNFIYNHNR